MSNIFGQILRQTAARRCVYGSTLRFCSKQTTAYNKENLNELVRKTDVVVFMKGTPESPLCGFSNAVVQILRMHGVPYEAHNVLANEELRQNIKDFSDWPTIPQIYIKGEFVGGCDILLQMHQSGDLIEELKKVGIKSHLLKASTTENPEKNTNK